MLEDLTSMLTRAGSRLAGAAVRRLFAVCALSLLAAALTFAPAAGASPCIQAAPPPAAEATLPVFVGFAIQGDAAHLRIGMRNTGETAWDPSQGFRLRRLNKDGTPLEGESYPVEVTVPAGQTATWDLVISPQRAGLEDRRYGMFEGESAFGSTARAMLIVLPNLQGTEEVLRSGMGGTYRKLAHVRRVARRVWQLCAQPLRRPLSAQLARSARVLRRPFTGEGP